MKDRINSERQILALFATPPQSLFTNYNNFLWVVCWFLAKNLAKFCVPPSATWQPALPYSVLPLSITGAKCAKNANFQNLNSNCIQLFVHDFPAWHFRRTPRSEPCKKRHIYNYLKYFLESDTSWMFYTLLRCGSEWPKDQV